MIPYIHFTGLQLGPVFIHTWGVMVALGFLIGALASSWMMRKRGLDQKIIWDLLFWIIIASFVSARLFHVVFYDAQTYLSDPIQMFRVWEGGMSSVGGYIGAAIASIIYLRKKHLDVLRYADAIVFGLPLGLFIGRIGCFLLHEHPGIATNFFLGVKYPDGIVRHDLGLYLLLNNLILFLIFLILAKKKVKEGTYIILFLIWYGIIRFGLDFLRAYNLDVSDARYLGLTPAQYVSVLMLAAGIYLYLKIARKKI